MKKVFVLVLVIVLGGSAWWYVNNSFNKTPPPAAPSELVVTDPNAAAHGPATPIGGTPNTVTIPLTGSSDAALDQYVANVDIQMSGLATDNTKADSGLSAQ